MGTTETFSGSLKSSAGKAMGCLLGILLAFVLAIGGCFVILGGVAASLDAPTEANTPDVSPSDIDLSDHGTLGIGGDPEGETDAEETDLSEDFDPDPSDSHSQAVPDAAATGSEPTRARPRSRRPPPDLVLESWRFSREYSFVKVVGEVTNTTSRRLKNVQVIASFYDSNGDLVKTESALIEFNPILPGQTSPFETLGTDNPAIKTASVRFSYLFGSTLSYETRDELERPAREAAEAKRLEEERLIAERDAQREQDRLDAIEKAKERTWTSGGYSVKAKFLKQSAGQVYLLRLDNGREITVPFARLSKVDQDWIRKKKWEDTIPE